MSVPSARHGRSERVAELDGVRAIAVLLVLLHHYWRGLPPQGAVDAVLINVAAFGWIGVDLFFLLSGYLITTILLEAKKEGTQVLGAFYARRVLRIFPAYYLLLALLFIAAPAIGSPIVGDSVRHAPWFWLYGANFLIAVRDWPHAVLAPLWSLAVEEHFYLLWPLLILGLPARILPVTTLLIAFGSAGLRAFVLSDGWTTSAAYVLTFTRLDGLAVGAFVGTVFRPGQRVPSSLFRISAMVALCFLTLAGAVATAGFGHWGTWSPSSLVWGLLILALGLGCGLVAGLGAAPDHGLRRFLRWRPLSIVGQRSYGMYLYHMPLIAITARLGLDPAAWIVPGRASWPFMALYAVIQGGILLAVAEASFRFVEAPFLRLKDRFPYHRGEGSTRDPGSTIQIAARNSS
jgi:peptidoglycan/LPS O-acetylase OafA/YrhL